MSKQTNLQDPVEAANWLQQAWQSTRPPVNADQTHTLMMAAAIHSVCSSVKTLIGQVHEFRNKITELEGQIDQVNKPKRRASRGGDNA